MKIIDAHMHFSNIQAFYKGAEDSGVLYNEAGLAKEYTNCGVVKCVCMGLQETAPGRTPDKNADTPMFADLPNSSIDMGVCLGVNPHRLEPQNITAAEKAIKQNKKVVGFKIYAGYYHVDVRDELYAPIYRLAAAKGLPVAIHSGETYFKGGLIEYSRPLHVDRIAYQYPDVNFVICHVGFPWVMEACEVATKNDNVYVDISGLAVGDKAECEKTRDEPLIRDFFRQGLIFLNNYKKVIFGTDWPLAPIGPYIDMCKAIIPEKAWGDVFYENAARVYGWLAEDR